MRADDRLLAQLGHALLQSPQGTQQVAAVHRRDKAWLERRQSLDVVPVQQVAVVALHTVDRFHGVVERLDDLIDC